MAIVSTWVGSTELTDMYQENYQKTSAWLLTWTAVAFQVLLAPVLPLLLKYKYRLVRSEFRTEFIQITEEFERKPKHELE
jgi:hypothetical protein